MCFVVISAALARARSRPHFKARLPARLECFLVSLNVFDVNSHSEHFARKKNKAVDQAVSRLRAHEGLVALVVFFNVFFEKPLQLLVCDLHADGLLGFARRHQHGQLLTKNGNVRSGGGKVWKNTNWSALRLGFQHIH